MPKHSNYSALLPACIYCILIICFAATCIGCSTPKLRNSLRTLVEDRDVYAAFRAARIPEKFDVFILMGQSNMVGIYNDNTLNRITSKVLAFNTDLGKWRPAKEPLHGYGIGPGIPFATELIDNNWCDAVGLIPMAVNGSNIKSWMAGGVNFEKTIRVLDGADFGDSVVAVLWLQGESDSGSISSASNYKNRLEDMIVQYRNELKMPNLIFIMSGIGSFLSDEKYPGANIVNEAMRSIASDDDYVLFIDSKDLLDGGDKLHYSAKSAREIGMRMAVAFRSMRAVVNSR